MKSPRSRNTFSVFPFLPIHLLGDHVLFFSPLISFPLLLHTPLSSNPDLKNATLLFPQSTLWFVRFLCPFSWLGKYANQNHILVSESFMLEEPFRRLHCVNLAAQTGSLNRQWGKLNSKWVVVYEKKSQLRITLGRLPSKTGSSFGSHSWGKAQQCAQSFPSIVVCHFCFWKHFVLINQSESF